MFLDTNDPIFVSILKFKISRYGLLSYNGGMNNSSTNNMGQIISRHIIKIPNNRWDK